jgi:RNA polymerase sigma factor (sigma-70 family)
MATKKRNDVIEQLRKVVFFGDDRGPADGQLMDEYLRGGDEATLALLVKRHGPMVWGVCRRVLGESHDAEDAFQSTFLVFVRKAASVRPKEMIGNWLYGVAHQTALNARANAARRRAKETAVVDMPEPSRDRTWHDLLPHLDQELIKNSAVCPTNIGPSSSCAIWKGKHVRKPRSSSECRKERSRGGSRADEPCWPNAWPGMARK